MKARYLALTILLVVVVATPFAVCRAENSQEPAQRKRLAVVWTSGDPEVAHRMVLMYTHAAKQNSWFDEVRLVIWGPSSRLLAADKDVQKKVREMQRDGVDVKACIVCADSYGITKRLDELEIEVLPMGKPLTDMLQEEWTVMTF